MAATLPPKDHEQAEMSEPASGAHNYQVGREIARGGMGSVLEAEDDKLKRTVAVKVMLQDADASPALRQRFLREAEVLALLAHPNIVPIYDIVWEDGLPLFYSMKLVKGRTLQDILDQLQKGHPEDLREFTVDRLLIIFRKVCDAIAFAHSKGVLHRDLKPANVMVGEFGEVLVMDWGLAKTIRKGESEQSSVVSVQSGPAEAESRNTVHRLLNILQGSVMGTPEYMSPEQAAGQGAELDERSDLFSLGGILYAILTLRPPVEGGTLEEVLSKVKTATITAPADMPCGTEAWGKAHRRGEALEAKRIKPLPQMPGGRVPYALSAVAMKALCLDKHLRYPSVAALSADIEAYQRGFATGAENAGLTTQLALLIKRHKTVFSTVTAACLTVIALALWFIFHLRTEERETRRQAEIARAAEAAAVRDKEAARLSAARANLAVTEAALRDGDGATMQTALAAVPEDLRDATWHYLLGRSDQSIARIQIDGGGATDVAAHPLRPGVFAIASGGKVILMEVRTGRRLLEFTPESPSGSFEALKLAFSPDGERIAVGRVFEPGGIAIHRTRDGAQLLDWETRHTKALQFSPDGRLLFQSGSRFPTVWDAATGRCQWTKTDTNEVHGVFTPDSRQVICELRQIHILNARDGSLVRELSFHNANAMALSRDGRMLLIGGTRRDSGLITGLSVRDATVGFQAQPHDRIIQQLAFTPEGGRFVSVAVHSNGVQAIQLWDATTGAPLQTLLGGKGSVSGAAVHPLSGELVVAGVETRVWNLTGTLPRWTLPSHDGDSGIAFWGSDDHVLAATRDFRAALQKLGNGEPDVLWTPPKAAFRRITISADGSMAAIGSDAGHADGQEPNVLFLRRSGAQREMAGALKVQEAVQRQFRLSPNGALLAKLSIRRGRVHLFDVHSGQERLTLEDRDLKQTQDIQWLNDGREIIGLCTAKAERGDAGSEEWIVVWDTVTGKIVRTLLHATAMDVLVVSPDGRRLAEAGVDKKVRIRDAATLAVQQEIRAHDAPITALAWHPSKPIVATASADLSVKLWNLETGRCLEELRGMKTAPDSLAFSPSGQRLGCAGNGNPTRIWEPKSIGGL